MWEVGIYLLVQHHDGESLCDTLEFQKGFLGSQQYRKDDEEQIRHKSNINNDTTEPATPLSAPGLDSELSDSGENLIFNDNSNDDAEFEMTLNNLFHYLTAEDFLDENEESDKALTDI